MIADNPEYTPRRATKHSAGYDVYAPRRMVVTKQWQTFDLGFRFEDGDMKPSQFAMMLVRSSVGNKKGVHMRTGVSIIDADYRQNVLITLAADTDEVVFEQGDRIIQLILCGYEIALGEITPTEERTGGVGSTGQ